ncbi:MAG TPA: hypothetical protein VIY72_06280 [Acidimicrobiales bacterium]
MANHKKTRKPRKPQHHLPKVGTPADDAYRLHRSREDVVDFGLIRSRGRGVNVVLAVLALVVLALGVLALVAITA